MNEINEYIKKVSYLYRKKTVVYKITNPVGQAYIGVTTKLYNRLQYHAKGMRYTKRSTLSLLHESVNKHGFINHAIDILWSRDGKHIKTMYKKEVLYINSHNTWNGVNPDGLNIKFGTNNIVSSLRIPHRKCVYQYDILTGRILGEYPTIHEASRCIGKSNGTANISKCCKGGKRYAYGFYWSFDKKDFYKPDVCWKNKKIQTVYKVYKDGTMIYDVYRSISEAANKNNVPSSEMWLVINYRRTLHDKFLFIKAA